ncbi:unnamed protein product [Cunninghamella echinulata]
MENENEDTKYKRDARGRSTGGKLWEESKPPPLFSTHQQQNSYHNNNYNNHGKKIHQYHSYSHNQHATNDIESTITTNSGNNNNNSRSTWRKDLNIKENEMASSQWKQINIDSLKNDNELWLYQPNTTKSSHSSPSTLLPQQQQQLSKNDDIANSSWNTMAKLPSPEQRQLEYEQTVKDTFDENEDSNVNKTSCQIFSVVPTSYNANQLIQQNLQKENVASDNTNDDANKDKKNEISEGEGVKSESNSKLDDFKQDEIIILKEDTNRNNYEKEDFKSLECQIDDSIKNDEKQQQIDNQKDSTNNAEGEDEYEYGYNKEVEQERNRLIDIDIDENNEDAIRIDSISLPVMEANGLQNGHNLSFHSQSVAVLVPPEEKSIYNDQSFAATISNNSHSFENEKLFNSNNIPMITIDINENKNSEVTSIDESTHNGVYHYTNNNKNNNISIITTNTTTDTNTTATKTTNANPTTNPTTTTCNNKNNDIIKNDMSSTSMKYVNTSQQQQLLIEKEVSKLKGWSEVVQNNDHLIRARYLKLLKSLQSNTGMKEFEDQDKQYFTDQKEEEENEMEKKPPMLLNQRQQQYQNIIISNSYYYKRPHTMEVYPIETYSDH